MEKGERVIGNLIVLMKGQKLFTYMRHLEVWHMVRSAFAAVVVIVLYTPDCVLLPQGSGSGDGVNRHLLFFTYIVYVIIVLGCFCFCSCLFVCFVRSK